MTHHDAIALSARLDAAEQENVRLRDENENLRAQLRQYEQFAAKLKTEERWLKS